MLFRSSLLHSLLAVCCYFSPRSSSERPCREPGGSNAQPATLRQAQRALKAMTVSRCLSLSVPCSIVFLYSDPRSYQSPPVPSAKVDLQIALQYGILKRIADVLFAQAHTRSIARCRFVDPNLRDFKLIFPTVVQMTMIGDHADLDRKSTRLNSSHMSESRMPSSA